MQCGILPSGPSAACRWKPWQQPSWFRLVGVFPSILPNQSVTLQHAAGRAEGGASLTAFSSEVARLAGQPSRCRGQQSRGWSSEWPACSCCPLQCRRRCPMVKWCSQCEFALLPQLSERDAPHTLHSSQTCLPAALTAAPLCGWPMARFTSQQRAAVTMALALHWQTMPSHLSSLEGRRSISGSRGRRCVHCPSSLACSLPRRAPASCCSASTPASLRRGREQTSSYWGDMRVSMLV